LLLVLLPRAALGLDLRLQPFAVRSWDRSDAVHAVSQAPDGMIWFGSRSGLLRFDGERFVDVDVSEGEGRAGPWVRLVHAASDGSIWAATGAGSLELRAGPTRVVALHGQPTPELLRLDPSRPTHARERVRRFSSADGLPSPWVWALAEAPGGGLWIGTEDGLVHLVGGRFERFFTRDGLPSSFVTALTFGPDGALYVGTAAGVVVRRGDSFLPTAIDEPVLALTVDRAGRMWAAGRDRLLRVGPGAASKSFPADRPLALAVDLDDNVWASGRPRVFAHGEEAPLWGAAGSDRSITAMAVDREGSVWFTIREGGIVQLSVPRVRNFGMAEGLPGPVAFSVLQARDGSMFAALHGGVARYFGGAWTIWRSDKDLGWSTKDLAEGAPGGPNAGIWVASETLVRGGPQGFRLVRRATEVADAPDTFRTVVAARNGDLWVSRIGTGLLRFAGSDFSRPPIVVGPQDGACSAQLTHGLEASDGSLWFANYYGSGVVGATRIKDGRAHCYGPAEGLPAEIGALTEDREGALWLGTAWGEGLVRFRGERFVTVPASAGLPRTSITGLLDDGRDHLWIGSEAGVWRVPKGDLHRCAEGPCAGLKVAIFGQEEGMRTAECTGAFHPNMALGDQGSVWVATLKGLSMILPPERTQRAMATPVIEEIAVDGVPTDIAGTVRLGPRNRELVVRYTAASFLGESRPRLKHRLRGFDSDWIMAGPQPVAHYRDLPSGEYGLEIGVGEGERSVKRLVVIAEPPFWRRRSFVVLVLGLVVAVMVLVHRFRVVRLQLRHRAVTEERARIARDLHDGLSQKLRAISLLSERVRPVGPSEATEIERMQQIVGEAHGELRRAIWDMRDGAEGRQRLETVIERTLSALPVPPHTTLKLQASGSSLPVGALAAHEAPLVVKEAVTNALRHADARNIEVGVLSDEEGLHVWVRDDGRGMPAPAPGPARGYGLIGMHERARRLGGVLRIESWPQGGTQISLFVSRDAGGRS
jgi:ligand-binding sensor domain-containing protein